MKNLNIQILHLIFHYTEWDFEGLFITICGCGRNRGGSIGCGTLFRL